MKSLKIKGVNGTGEYTTVAEKIKWIEENLDYELTTDYVIDRYLNKSNEETRFIVKATLKIFTPSGTRTFTGLSQAVVGNGEINRDAALENAETSAVGRALSFAGIGVKNSIASAEEMQKLPTPQDTYSLLKTKLAEINTEDELEVYSNNFDMKDREIKKLFKLRRGQIILNGN